MAIKLFDSEMKIMIVREIGAISNYYDSKTVYFAVTK